MVTLFRAKNNLISQRSGHLKRKQTQSVQCNLDLTRNDAHLLPVTPSTPFSSSTSDMIEQTFCSLHRQFSIPPNLLTTITFTLLVLRDHVSSLGWLHPPLLIRLQDLSPSLLRSIYRQSARDHFLIRNPGLNCTPLLTCDSRSFPIPSKTMMIMTHVPR